MTKARLIRADDSKMKTLRRPHNIRTYSNIRVLTVIGMVPLFCATGAGCKDTSSPSHTVPAQHAKTSSDTSSTPAAQTPKVATPEVSSKPAVSDITDIKHTTSTHKNVRKKETTWRDGQGQNRFVINETRYANEHKTLAIVLEMSHSVVKHGKARQIRTFRERLKRCIKAQPLVRLPKITITDLDKDGIAEVTWAYSIGCRHKVNDWLMDLLEDEDGEVIKGVMVRGWTSIKGPTKPLKHKVLMTELGQKYAIRGETKVLKPTSTLKHPGECVFASQGGTKRVDPSFKGAPPSFLPHALEMWKETVEEPITCEHGSPG